MNSPDSASSPTKSPIAAIHDFGGKLCQPSLMQRLKDYVLWQVALRKGVAAGEQASDYFDRGPDAAPISINLDLTTACNFACDHCVDFDILNKGIRYDHEALLASLDLMCQKGLRSVILIGGGEPTVHPTFGEVVRFLKDRDVHVSVVSNGSRLDKIEEVADRFQAKDWVRLSLDSGTDPTFQAMHKPKKKITLEEICAGVPKIKKVNPGLRIGFSYIITWKGAFTNDSNIVENYQEIMAATRLAREHQFDYISLKPFLVRAEENNAEMVGMDDTWSEFDEIIRKIRVEVDKAKELATDDFAVIESTNLKVFEAKTYREFTRQPKNCHMQFFRQVLSPLGLYNCPVYRHVPHAMMGDKEAYAGDEKYAETRKKVAKLIHEFDASDECKEVTCLYNPANWFLEDLIENPHKLEELELSSEREDFFL